MLQQAIQALSRGSVPPCSTLNKPQKRKPLAAKCLRARWFVAQNPRARENRLDSIRRLKMDPTWSPPFWRTPVR